MQHVAYKEGQDVRKGELMIEIDPRPYQAALDQALANLERARAEQALARIAQDKRADADRCTGHLARRVRDPQGRLVAGQRRRPRRRSRGRRRAPGPAVHAGVPRSTAAPDARWPKAQADSTLFTTLVSQDPMYVYFESDEQAFLRYGALVRKERDGVRNPVRIGLADERVIRTKRTADFVDNQVDAKTGTIRARRRRHPTVCSRPACSPACSEGQGRFKAMLVDDKAVLTDQDRKYVYVPRPA